MIGDRRPLTLVARPEPSQSGTGTSEAGAQPIIGGVGSWVAAPKHIDMFVNRVIFSSFLTVYTTISTLVTYILFLGPSHVLQ